MSCVGVGFLWLCSVYLVFCLSFLLCLLSFFISLVCALRFLCTGSIRNTLYQVIYTSYTAGTGRYQLVGISLSCLVHTKEKGSLQPRLSCIGNGSTRPPPPRLAAMRVLRVYHALSLLKQICAVLLKRMSAAGLDARTQGELRVSGPAETSSWHGN